MGLRRSCYATKLASNLLAKRRTLSCSVTHSGPAAGRLKHVSCPLNEHRRIEDTAYRMTLPDSTIVNGARGNLNTQATWTRGPDVLKSEHAQLMHRRIDAAACNVRAYEVSENADQE